MLCLAVGRVGADHRAIRGDAFRRSWPGLACGSPARTQRLPCARDVGVGTHDGSGACTARTKCYPVIVERSAHRASRLYLRTRRHGCDGQ